MAGVPGEDLLDRALQVEEVDRPRPGRPAAGRGPGNQQGQARRFDRALGRWREGAAGFEELDVAGAVALVALERFEQAGHDERRAQSVLVHGKGIRDLHDRALRWIALRRGNEVHVQGLAIAEAGEERLQLAFGSLGRGQTGGAPRRGHGARDLHQAVVAAHFLDEVDFAGAVAAPRGHEDVPHRSGAEVRGRAGLGFCDLEAEPGERRLRFRGRDVRPRGARRRCRGSR